MASRFGSDKEVSAVAFNLKQQRLMEKTMNTLSLEESYALKLLEINKRIVKVNYGRMSDKVAQINSFLTPEEIRILNEMEASGNFKSLNSAPNFSPSLRISSAEKRLKLNTPRPHTAIPYDTEHEDPSSSRRAKRCKSRQRRRSLTGECQSGDEEAMPRQSATEHSRDNKERHARPKTAFAHTSPTKQSEYTSDQIKPSGHGGTRPVTAVQKVVSDPSMNAGTPRRERAKTAPISKGTVPQYNSHEGNNPEVRTLNSAIGVTPRSRSSAELNRAAIDGNMSGNNFQERKMEMLKMEAQRGLEFESKKNDFLQKVGEHVKSNPTQLARKFSIKPPQPENQEQRQAEGKTGPKGRRLRKRHTAEFARISDDDYKQRLEDSWKDLTKCRYLRIPGQEQDISTENTLVKNQIDFMKIFQRKGSSRSFLKDLQL